MTTCDYCQQESKLIFTCPHCESHFCRDHRKPKNHECISVNKEKTDIIIEESSKIDNLNSVVLHETSDLMNINNESELKSNEVFTYFQENLEMDQEIIYPLDDEKDSDLVIIDREIQVKQEQEEIVFDEPFSENKSQKSPLSGLIRKEAFLVIMLLFGIILGQMMTTVINPDEYDQNLQQRYDRIYEYYMETQALNVELNVMIDNLTTDLVSIESQLNQITIEYNQLLDDYQSLQSE